MYLSPSARISTQQVCSVCLLRCAVNIVDKGGLQTASVKGTVAHLCRQTTGPKIVTRAPLLKGIDRVTRGMLSCTQGWPEKSVAQLFL